MRGAISDVTEHSTAKAQRLLRQLALDDHGIKVEIRVIDPSSWKFGNTAGGTKLVNGRAVVYIRNGPLNEFSDTLRHEMEHVWQTIRHPGVFWYATFRLGPASSLFRFAIELPAHAKHTQHGSALVGATRETFSHHLQYGSDLFYAFLFGVYLTRE